MSAHTFDASGMTHCPFMPVFGAAAGDVRARPGHRAVGHDGQALPRLPVRARRHVARARQPGGRRGDRRAGRARCCTSATCSPTSRWPRGAVEDRRAAPDGPGAPARCSSATPAPRPTSAAIKLARKFGGRGRHIVVGASGASTAARWRRWPPPVSRPSTSRSSPMPEGFRHVPWDDLDAMRGRRRRTVAAVLIEPVQGEGGVNPATPGYLQGIRDAVRRAGHPDDGRRDPDRLRPHRRWFGFEHYGVQPRRRHAGEGAGQRRADRRLLGPARGGRRVPARRPRHAPTAAPPSPRRRSSAVVDEMRRLDAPALAATQGAPAHSAPRGDPAGRLGARRRAAARGELAEGGRCAGRGQGASSVPASSSTASPRRRCASPRRSPSPAEMAEAASMVAAVLARASGLSPRSFLDITDLTVDELRLVIELGSGR